MIKLKYKFIEALIKTLTLCDFKNRGCYYDIYYGTSNKFINKLKNILKPNRIRAMKEYGQFKGSAPQKNKARSLPADFAKNSLRDTLEYSSILETFCNDGCITLPGILKDEANSLLRRMNVNHDDNSYKTYCATVLDPRASKEIFRFVTHPLITSLLADLYKCQPVIKRQPRVQSSETNMSYAEFLAFDSEQLGYKSNRNMCWHYDVTSAVVVFLLLEDLTTEQPHMLFAKGSHLTNLQYIHPTIDYHASEEYVRKNFEIAEAIGPAGSVFMFQSDGWHRLNPTITGVRRLASTVYSPGSDIGLVTKSKFEGLEVRGYPDPDFRFEKEYESISEVQQRVLDTLGQ